MKSTQEKYSKVKYSKHLKGEMINWIFICLLNDAEIHLFAAEKQFLSYITFN